MCERDGRIEVFNKARRRIRIVMTTFSEKLDSVGLERGRKASAFRLR